jgi:hypothetical protein
MSVQATTKAFLQVIRRGKENFALRRAIEFGRKDRGKDLFWMHKDDDATGDAVS